MRFEAVSERNHFSRENKQSLVIALFTSNLAIAPSASESPRHSRHLDALHSFRRTAFGFASGDFHLIQDRVTMKNREMEIEMRSYSCLNLKKMKTPEE